MWLLSKQNITEPNCLAIVSYACMKALVNINFIWQVCLLDVDRNGRRTSPQTWMVQCGESNKRKNVQVNRHVSRML